MTLDEARAVIAEHNAGGNPGYVDWAHACAVVYVNHEQQQGREPGVRKLTTDAVPRREETSRECVDRLAAEYRRSLTRDQSAEGEYQELFSLQNVSEMGEAEPGGVNPDLAGPRVLMYLN
jgi:hypothetical protein